MSINEMFNYCLDKHLSQCCNPTFPDNILKLKFLKSKYMVEVCEYRDIRSSNDKQNYLEINSKPNRMYYFIITDGTTKVKAIEYTKVHIFDTINFYPSVKIQIENVIIRDGILLLNNNNVKWCGGVVKRVKDKFIQKQEAVNKDKRIHEKALKKGETPPPRFQPVKSEGKRNDNNNDNNNYDVKYDDQYYDENNYDNNNIPYDNNQGYNNQNNNNNNNNNNSNNKPEIGYDNNNGGYNDGYDDGYDEAGYGDNDGYVDDNGGYNNNDDGYVDENQAYNDDEYYEDEYYDDGNNYNANVNTGNANVMYQKKKDHNIPSSNTKTVQNKYNNTPNNTNNNNNNNNIQYTKKQNHQTNTINNNNNNNNMAAPNNAPPQMQNNHPNSLQELYSSPLPCKCQLVMQIEKVKWSDQFGMLIDVKDNSGSCTVMSLYILYINTIYFIY